MNKVSKIEISSKTIIFTVFFILFLNFLWIVRDLIFSLFIAFIIMSAVKPVVAFFERGKIPRVISSIIIFILLFVGLGWLFSSIIPLLIIETSLLFRQLPAIISQLDPAIANTLNLGALNRYLPDITNQAVKIITSVFSNAIFFMSTIFFSFYFTVEENFIKKLLIKFFDESKAVEVAIIFEKTEKRLSSWFWGELVLMIVVGSMTYVGLMLLGIKNALPLAVVAGILEIVPNLGPILSLLPAILITATQSYFLILPTIALYTIVQQLENHLIVPLVMKKAVGLNPIITLIALIIGGRIGGTLGILLAVPTALFVETVIIEILQKNQS